MPRRCSVCQHADRAQIDQALARGTSLREIARAHPGISRQAIARHREGGHIAERVEKAAVAAEFTQAKTVADEIRGLKRLAAEFMQSAADHQQFGTALRGVQELTRLIGLGVATNATPENQEAPQLLIVHKLPNGEEIEDEELREFREWKRRREEQESAVGDSQPTPLEAIDESPKWKQ